MAAGIEEGAGKLAIALASYEAPGRQRSRGVEEDTGELGAAAQM
ncbi:hypothetical protein [Sorangium sp. So ce693]